MTVARPYREGDKVRLKEADQIMTVVVASDSLVFCEWTVSGAAQHQVFRYSQLEQVEPPSAPQPPSAAPPPLEPQA